MRHFERETFWLTYFEWDNLSETFWVRHFERDILCERFMGQVEWDFLRERDICLSHFEWDILSETFEWDILRLQIKMFWCRSTIIWFILQAYHVTDSALSYFSPKQTGTLNILRLQSCWEITNHGIVNIGKQSPEKIDTNAVFEKTILLLQCTLYPTWRYYHCRAAPK